MLNQWRYESDIGTVITRTIQACSSLGEINEWELKHHQSVLENRVRAFIAMLVPQKWEPPHIAPRIADTLRAYPWLVSDPLFQDMLVRIMEGHTKSGYMTDFIDRMLRYPDIFRIREQILSNPVIQECLRETMTRLEHKRQPFAAHLRDYMNPEMWASEMEV